MRYLRLKIDFRKIIWCWALGMALNTVYGQYDAALKSYIPVSPNAASLGKVAEAAVSSFTGAINVDIPLFGDVENELNYGVSLGYNTTGIKASETASSIGLGWSLNAGGAIVRAMRGAPDESLFSTQLSGYYSHGVDTNWFSNSIHFDNIFAGKLDIQSDVYYYNFMGYSGAFFFDHKGNIIERIPSNMKIEVINTGYQFNKLLWKITTPDGNIFYFGDDNIADGVGDDAVGYSNQYGQPKDLVGAPDIYTPLVDSWYLVKMESFDKKSVVHFDYDEYEAYSFRDVGTSGNYYIDSLSVLYSFSPVAFVDLNTTLCTESLTPRLTKIRTSKKTITFTYGSDIRKDLDDWGTPGYHPRYQVGVPSSNIYPARALTEIAIKSSDNTLLHKYNLHHSYFISNADGFDGTFGLAPQTDTYGSYYTDMRRLKLDSISLISGSDIIHQHKFSYFDTNIQRRCSYAQDTYGFPNGQTSNISLLPRLKIDTLAASIPMVDLSYMSALADRSVSELHTKKASLQTITYPYGGSRTFDFESHDHYTNTVVTIPGTLMTLKNCSNPGANCPGGTYYSGAVSMPENNTVSYTISLQGIKTAMDMSSLPIDVQLLVSTDGGSNYQITANLVLNSGNGFNVTEVINTLPYSASSTYHFGIWAPSHRNVFMNLVVNQFTRTDLATNVLVGGLRIKSVTDAPLDGSPIVTTLEYTKAPGNNQSSGFIVSTPVYINVLPLAAKVTAGFTSGGCTGVLCGMVNLVTNPACLSLNYSFNSGSTFSLSSTQGSHIGYHKVRKYISTNQGYKEYSHIVDENFRSKPFKIYPSLPEFFVPDSIGKPDTIRDITQGGNVIRTEAFDYLDYDFMANDTSYYTDRHSECGLIVYVWGRYKNRSRFNQVNKKTTTADGVSTVESYQYQALPIHTFMTSSSTVNSDGKVFSTDYLYLDNYTVNTAIKNQLLAENRWLPAWQTVTKSNNTIVDGNQTLYAYQNQTTGLLVDPTNVLSDSKIYPAKINRREVTWNAGNSLQDNGWQLSVENLKYDLISGKPSLIHANGWAHNHTLNWSANGKLTSASYANHSTAYTYNALSDLLMQKTNVDGTYQTYLYDNIFRLKTETALPRNVQSTYTYFYPSLSSERPYVKSRTTYPPNIQSALDSIVNITFTDGLGRPTQAIHKYGAPDGADVITKSEYDNVGRPYRSYEAIPATDNHGAYYTGAFGGGYTQTLYEASPLNRPSQTTPPAWQTSYQSYGTNTTALTNPEGLVYPANSLMRTTTTDPDALSTDIYTDKAGRAVLQRQRDASNTTDTWTVYDDKSRPAKVYPPGSSTSTPGLIFEFRYDGDDNVVYKKVPDAAAEEYRYSVRNLQTAMRNAVLQAQGRWLVTHYDEYGRPSKRGYHSGSDPGNVETPTIHTLLEEYFYDGYNGSTTNTAPIYKGKLKKSRIKVLTDGGANSNWVETEYFYDIYGRVMTETITNHLGGTETKMYAYDFADNVTLETHNISGPNGVNHTTKHTYDAQGRKVYDILNINGTGERTTSECVYDHKNQIIERNLGRHSTSGTNQYLQSLDYTYNPQGWLTKINELSDQLLPGFDPCDTGISTFASGSMATSPDNDIFAFAIDYNSTISASGVPARQNGNITALKWWHLNQYNQTYSYKYDHLNRVTEARHGEIQGTVYHLMKHYDEKFLYDSRGNILKLDRKGMVQRSDIDDYCYQPMTIDSLDYIYTAGTNRLIQVVDKAPCMDVITLPRDIDRDIIYAANQTIIIDKTMVHCGVDMSLYAPNTYIKDSLILAKETCTAPMVATYPGPCPQTKYTEGFQQQSANGLYTYDTGGNLTYDPNKKLTFYYNHHNLPYRITGAENDELQMLYAADGTLLQRKYIKNGVQKSKIDYLRGKELNNDLMESVYHNDGRVIKSGNNWKYEYHIKDHLGNVRVTFVDDNNNGLISGNEIRSRNDYYSFGMEWNNRWELSDTISPENRYRYNGKELFEEMKLDHLYFGSRFYDGEIGRFWVPDILSHKMPSWSGYSYGFGNPLRFIDPDGKAPEDIIIRGTRDDKGDAFRVQTFRALQSLTDDKLKLGKDGRISIVKQGSGDKSHGTELIRNLVEGKTASGNDFDVVITNDSRGTDVNTKIQAEAFADSPENASNGIGTGSKIVISPELNASLHMQDGTKEKAPYNIAVGHELIHSDHVRLGVRSVKSIDNLPYIKNTEELKTINRENILRFEQGFKLRYNGNFMKIK